MNSIEITIRFFDGDDPEQEAFATTVSRRLAEKDRYWQALVDIAGYENWQGDPKPAVIAARALAIS